MALLQSYTLLALVTLSFGYALPSSQYDETALDKRDVPCSPQNMEAGAVSFLESP